MQKNIKRHDSEHNKQGLRDDWYESINIDQHKQLGVIGEQLGLRKCILIRFGEVIEGVMTSEK